MLISDRSLTSIIPTLIVGQIDTSTLPLPPSWQFLGSDLLSFGKAVLILIVGWIVAIIAKNAVQALLKRTNIDNKVVNWIGGGTENEINIEKWIAEVVFWLILLFVVVAFLNTLKLEAVSQPLNALLAQVTSFLPQIFGAGALLGLAWLLATLTKMVVIRVFQQFRLDQKLGQINEDTNQFPLSETIGNALYWFIFLVFLPAILSTLRLEGTLVPVQTLLNNILGILPNIFAAVILGAVGWVIAQIVRRIVTNLLAATGVDQVGTRFGLTDNLSTQSLSQIIGSIVYALVLIPTAIIALDALQIRAISQPATEMLNQVLAFLPKLFAASVVLALAYVGGRYLSLLVTNILSGLGFNNVFQWLGIAKPKAEVSQELIYSTAQTPSQIMGTVVLVAVMLVASLTAVDILQIEALKTVVGVILVIAGQIFVGLLVFAVGLYLSNLAYTLITSYNTRQSKILGHTARISIIVLVSAMALQQMGIAPNIVNLAFGLLVGGIAVAIALAFGLGGREVAGEQLRKWVETFHQDQD